MYSREGNKTETEEEESEEKKNKMADLITK